MNKIDLGLARKWRIAPMLGLSLFLFSASAAWAQASSDLNKRPDLAVGEIPRFKAIELLKVDGKVVGNADKITFASPEFADWDGDGKIDLIVGYWASWSIGPRRGAGDGGKVRFFKNIGKKEFPEYKDMGDLTCDGGLVRLKEA